MKIGLSLLLLAFASASLLSQTPETPSQPPAASNERTASSSTSAILPELDKLESVAAQASAGIKGLRIEKWKANDNAKSAAQADADSVQRNLTSALPGMIKDLRSEPANLNAGFKLYRNLSALCDVFGTLTESARVFGPRSDYEALQPQLYAMSSVRRKLADALDQLTASTQQELEQLRAQTKLQQQELEAAKAEAAKVVVAPPEPPPKAAQKKKKSTKKKPAAAASGSKPATPSPDSSSQTGAGTTVPKS